MPDAPPGPSPSGGAAGGATSSTAQAKGSAKHAVVVSPSMQDRSASMSTGHGQMSVQAQLDMNDVPEYANEPGPGHYFGPESYCFSSVGKQKLSKCQSAPEVSIAKTGWDEWSRVVITKGHEKAFMGRASAGFMYTPKDETLREIKAGVPGGGTKIGTSQRPDLAASLGVDPAGSPGPTYNLRDVPNPEERMIRRRDRSFGLAGRFANIKPGQLGPGQYDRNDVSLKPGTGKSFGCRRSAYDKVIRPGWEKEGACRVSLGVGPPLWSDIQRDGSLATTIGRAERFPRGPGSDAPGPGQYNHEERGITATLGKKQGSVCSDTARPGSIKFGKLPKKPRFRVQLAQNTAKHGGWGYF